MRCSDYLCSHLCRFSLGLYICNRYMYIYKDNFFSNSCNYFSLKNDMIPDSKSVINLSGLECEEFRLFF